MMDAAVKKNTGSYYTCGTIADYIAKWAIETPETCVLEPSFGDGIFIDSALSRFAELSGEKPKIIGVELQPEPFTLFMNGHKEVSGFRMDFMDFRTTAKINAVIGNPPYVSLKKLTSEQRNKALRLVSSYGLKMRACGSLWMPFIIHSTELLDRNGRLGFVLPYEITHVRYSFDLWKYLSLHYGKLTVCRIYRDFFPDVDVETIILLAEEKGAETNAVYYKVFKTLSDLYNDDAGLVSRVDIKDICALNKPFERELISQPVVDFLDSLRKNGAYAPFIRDCKFKIGYVSGSKSFFQLTPGDIKRNNIHIENTKKSLINAKQIAANGKIGVETKGVSNCSYLFYPLTIRSGEERYISRGEKQGVDKGYKCRARKPWYLTPGLEIPDLILTVFGDVPKMLLNNGGFYVSNSLLSGCSKARDPKEIICRWYNSLTLLSIEITIHSLGGGTLVLIPGETDRLEIVAAFPAEKTESTYRKIAGYARNHSTAETYEYGDTVVLKEIYGFSDEIIEKIRNSLFTLRGWRDTEKRRGGKHPPRSLTAG